MRRGFQRRGAIAGTALICAVATMVMLPSPAMAEVPEYQETAEFIFDSGVPTGAATTTARDTVAFTRTLGQSVQVVTLDSDGVPVTEQTLTPENSGDSFGIDLALNDDASLLYVSQSGAFLIHVYERVSEMWQLQRTVAAPEPDEVSDRIDSFGRNFGSVIDVSGDRLVAGVPNAQIDGMRNAGAVFSLDLGTSVWSAHIPANPIAESITGSQVAVSGDRIAAGAPQVRNESFQRIGGVYLWDISADAEPSFTPGPDVDPRMCISSTGSGPAFGNTLSFTDAGLAVGSPIETNYIGDDPDSDETGCVTSAVIAGNTTQGAVYFFNNELQQTGPKVVAPLFTTDFGGSIAASGDTLAVRGVQENSVGYVFTYNLDTLDFVGTGDENGRQRPEPVQALTPSGEIANFANSPFGTAISMTDTQIAVGTWTQPGAANIFAAVNAPPEPIVLSTGDVSITYGQEATLTATIETGDIAADATIRFVLDGTPLVDAPIEEGVASVAVEPTTYDSGSYPFTVELIDASQASSEPASATFTVEQAGTETNVMQEHVDDAHAAFSGDVAAQYGTVPTGSVDIVSDGETVATVDLDETANFTWSAPITELDATYVLRYLGDTNHTDSSTTVLVPGAGVPDNNDHSNGEDSLSETGTDILWPWIALAVGAVAAGSILLLRRFRL